MEVYTTELDPEEYDGSVEPLGRWGNRTLDVGGRGVCWLAELEEVRSVDRVCDLLNIAELCVRVVFAGYGCEAESIIDLVGAGS